MVRSPDRLGAIKLLRSVSVKNILDVEHDCGENWIVMFHPNVAIHIEAPGQEQARRAAAWLTYLDRRDLKIVAVV